MEFNRLLFVLACIPLMAQESISRVAFSDSENVVTVFSSSGAIALPAVHLQLDISYPRGRKERRDLSVVYDPQNGHYLWRLASFPAPVETGRFMDGMKSNKEVIYADADGLLDVLFRSDLWVKVYKSRADSLDAAERGALAEIQQGLASIERYQPRRGPAPPTWPWDYKPVDLGRAITSDFRCLPMHANCKDELDTVVSIGKQGGNWRIVLRNRWDQEVILDSKFDLVRTQRLAAP
jgi:hypothetical protein